MSSDRQTPYRPDELETVETRDGSRTLFDRERDVHYSSLHGAVDESRHIFVRGTGLAERPPPWRLLELGFGAGINFVQTIRALRDQHDDGTLEYHAVDYAPVSPDDVAFHDGEAGEMVRRALEGIAPDAPEPVRVEDETGRVTLTVHPTAWRDLELGDFRADTIFFDPFGPKSEPDSWSADCFEVARRHLQPDALLGTYSAATDVKRAMFEAGLAVASADGPGPKHEITFAARRSEALDDYEQLDRDDYLGGDDA
jgi:tRNA U34 5-methylaminomethyl-2-thiouridine-forming methyltransferase MnmC